MEKSLKGIKRFSHISPIQTRSKFELRLNEPKEENRKIYINYQSVTLN